MISIEATMNSQVLDGDFINTFCARDVDIL
jgi:hypothetical protein